MQVQEKVINGFRLSLQQKHLWHLQKDNSAYCVQGAIFIEGNLKADVLQLALEQVVKRQEILRTNFLKPAGIKTPMQSINEQGFLVWQEIDFSEYEYQEQLNQVESLLQQERLIPWDLENGAMLRCSLIHLSANKYILLLNLPAICADSCSLKNLVAEISQCYDASLQGIALNSEEVIQYLQFSEWQNELLTEPDAEVGKKYWQQYDLSALPGLTLPWENKSVNDGAKFNLAAYECQITSDLLSQIEALVKNYQSSIANFLVSCWQILLWRLTAKANIVIGIAADGRKYEELETVIGMLTQYLPISVNLDNNLSFREVLDTVNQQLAEAEEWQEYFSWQNCRESPDDFDSAYFPFSFEWQTEPEKYTVGAVSFSIDKQFACTDRCKIKLSGYPKADGLILTFNYDVNLFGADFIQRLAAYFQTLVASVVAAPENTIAQFELLNECDRHQLLVEFNHTPTELTEQKCFQQVFAEQVARTPNNIAVVFEEETLTYAELNSRSNQLAHYLQKLGVKPEVLVGIYMHRSLEMMIALLAILKAGGAYLPLDPDLPVANLCLRLQDAKTEILLTQQDLAAELETETVKVICIDELANTLATESSENPHTDTSIANLAYVIYTSGSTGKPKGVAIEHQQLFNYVSGIIQRLNIAPQLSFATVSTLAADLGNTAIFPALSTGGCLHIIAKERATDPQALADYFSRHAIDFLKIVPSHLEAILTSVNSKSVLPRQRLILGGEVTTWNLIEKIQKLAPECQIINHYGPTETTVGVLTYQLDSDNCKYNSQTVPLGRPIANTQIYILDQYLQPVPIGVQGEIYIGGAAVARGYLHHPELTQTRFITNPFTGDGEALLYKTGDLARYLPDGNIEFLGRVDNQVKIRGYRIELAEIETVLSQNPDVAQAVVIPREDTPGDKRLVAYVVAENKRSLNTHELRSFLQAKLPDYMIPAAFMLLKSLPLTANGKVDRQALPIPVIGEIESFIPPRTPVEQVLAKIWAELLGLEKVSVAGNFFELGGHSLLLTQLVVRVREAFQINLPLSILFASPTVAGLAERIEISLKTGDVNVTAAEIDLHAEVVLDANIYPEQPYIWSSTEPKAIFLTGATGFLGSFLLAELLQQTQADIYCLVRAVNWEAAKAKIQSCLETYSLWQETFSSRIFPVMGELSQPLLGLTKAEFSGLASQIDMIYHNGAMVNFIYPYSVLKPTNVLGTQEILRLASQIKVKPVHFVSTTNAISPGIGSGVKVVRETDVIAPEALMDTGYAQSKWVAEKLINLARDRGLPISIYRPGRIVWHSETGVGNTSDNTFRMLKGCIQMGSVPAQDGMVNLIPVDFVSKAIIHLSRQQESLGKAFHLINPHPAPFPEIVNWVRSFGYQLREISDAEWRAELRTVVGKSPENALYPLVPFWSKKPEANTTFPILKFDCQNTLKGLQGSDIKCPPVSRELVNKFLSYLTQNGLIDSP
jgi:amino acid adenylation domain-containing protein/thioester reductase-like protein